MCDKGNNKLWRYRLLNVNFLLNHTFLTVCIVYVHFVPRQISPRAPLVSLTLQRGI